MSSNKKKNSSAKSKSATSPSIATKKKKKKKKATTNSNAAKRSKTPTRPTSARFSLKPSTSNKRSSTTGKSSGKSLTPLQPKHKKSKSNRVHKQSKSKYPKLEKCPGYQLIVRAEKCESERKFKAAVKHYNSGIEELEDYIKYNIDNAVEKRMRMKRVEEYRQRALKLQNKALVKSKSKAHVIPKAKVIPLEKEEGYQIVQQAVKLQKEEQLEKAVQLYNKGLTMLEKALPAINDSKEKEHRRQQIRSFRSEQQWCQNQLDHRDTKKKKSNKNKGNTSKAKEVVRLKEESGYQLCKKAEEFEKDKKYDVAISYYEKGIPQLEEQMLYNTNISSQKRERAKHIEQYRHKLQSLKNRNIRRMSVKFKAAKIPTTLRRDSRRQRDIGGGALYKNIRQGILDAEVIKYCHRLSVYHMLPIVASSILHAPLPFKSFMCDPLLEALNSKIELSPSLEQRLRLYLFSYYSHDIVQSLWGDHPCMPTMIDISDLDDTTTSSSLPSSPDDEKEDTNTHNTLADGFEDRYVDKDAILFFRKVAESNYPEVAQEIVIDSSYQDIYDIMGTEQKINKVRIDKIFKSNAKPLLLSCWQKQSDRKYNQISTFILKKGDDLRLDNGVMHMFRLFNSIWAEEGLFYESFPVQCLLYNVVPMGEDLGAIEFIDGCKPLRHVSEYGDGKFGKNELEKLVASAAGSFIASFVLGVRDRHFDNVLIQKDGTLFGIDFGYAMGAKLWMDTSKIAITDDLCKLMEDHWDNFVETATNAYMTLRLHYQEILDYSDLVFGFLELESNTSEFLYSMLKMHDTDKKAEDVMRKKLANAPSSWNTKIKNTAHMIATM